MFIFQQTRESWQVVFFICAGVLMFGGVVYSLLGSGVIQPWAHKDVAPAPDGESIASATTDTPWIYLRAMAVYGHVDAVASSLNFTRRMTMITLLAKFCGVYHKELTRCGLTRGRLAQPPESDYSSLWNDSSLCSFSGWRLKQISDDADCVVVMFVPDINNTRRYSKSAVNLIYLVHRWEGVYNIIAAPSNAQNDRVYAPKSSRKTLPLSVCCELVQGSASLCRGGAPIGAGGSWPPTFRGKGERGT